jgi:methylisocitrate lyase
VQLPIVSDAETGYGNVVNVVRAVREFERAGVAAIHIEDQMTRPNGQVTRVSTLASFPKKSSLPRLKPLWTRAVTKIW